MLHLWFIIDLNSSSPSHFSGFSFRIQWILFEMSWCRADIVLCAVLFSIYHLLALFKLLFTLVEISGELKGTFLPLFGSQFLLSQTERRILLTTMRRETGERRVAGEKNIYRFIDLAIVLFSKSKFPMGFHWSWWYFLPFWIFGIHCLRIWESGRQRLQEIWWPPLFLSGDAS